jgi:cytochrome bd-type quinol oxidase subunit 2
MITYSFLQHYWWFIISLLGGLLVFLLFVQGGQSMLFSLSKTDDEKRLLVNALGKKWEYTFTTLVTFGGAFFASFPLFYSTSFGGAYGFGCSCCFVSRCKPFRMSFNRSRKFSWKENLSGIFIHQRCFGYVFTWCCCSYLFHRIGI